MHSSRMRTARLLTESRGGLHTEGVSSRRSASGGGSAGGGSASGVGVCLQGFMQTPSLWRTNTCENITLPQTSFVPREIPKNNFRIDYQWQIQDFSWRGVNL